MEIDIIDFTSEQFSNLSNDQLSDVKTAQLKKNRLERELAREKRALKAKMLKNRTIRSDQYSLLMQELVNRYEMEIESVRDGLLFYLRYTVKPSVAAPYLVDYTLDMEKRLEIVWGYYKNAYSNAIKRYNAFIEDKAAPAYLGEFYAALKDNLYYEAYGTNA